MANTPITMQQIRQVLTLLNQRYSKRKISHLTGIHRSVIDKYFKRLDRTGLDFEQALSMDDAALSELFFDTPQITPEQSRRIDFDFFYQYIHKELNRVGVTRHLLHTEYLKKYPSGYRYSQFCERILQRAKQQDVSMVQPYVAGELMQVDFAGKKLSWTDRDTGEIIFGETLIVTLCYSGLTYVEVLRSQRQEDFVDGIRNALCFFGGVPGCIRIDNLKSGVIKSERYEPTFNNLLIELANHYGMGVDATRPYKPKDKPLVERHVNLVYQRIYAPLRNDQFYSLREINHAIRPLQGQHNDRPYQGGNRSRNLIFVQDEKITLKPLPEHPFTVKRRKNIKVQKNYHVYLSEGKDQGHYYSLPYQYVSKVVQVIFDSQVIEIFHDYKRIAIHQRDHGKGRYSTLAAHMPENHQAVANGMNPLQLIAKAKLIGPSTELFIKQLLDRGDFCQQNFKSCQGVLALARKYPEQRVEQAAERALYYKTVQYTIIKNILDRNLDQSPLDNSINQTTLPFNHQARGASYYTQ
jgi:transposase